MSGDITLLGSWPGPVSPAGKPVSSGLRVLTALSKQLQEPTLAAFGSRGAGKEEEVQQKRNAPAASVASQTKTRNQNTTHTEVSAPNVSLHADSL